jgi:hypothetical protein
MDLALPDTREAFDKTNREYGFAATINNLSRERSIQNNRHTMSLPAAGATVAGFSMGGGVPGAVAGYYGNRLAHSYGQDMGANTMRALQWMGEGAGQGGPGAMRQMAPQIAGRVAPSVSEREAHARKVGDEGRGYNLESVVVQALNTNPQILGPYARDLQEAQQSGDPMRLTGVLSNLNRDPQFRATVGQRLMQMTARGGPQ